MPAHNRRIGPDCRALADSRVQTIMAALRDASGGDTERPLVITADGKTPHELVVRAMDAAGRAGFAKLSITTRQPPGAAGDSP